MKNKIWLDKDLIVSKTKTGRKAVVRFASGTETGSLDLYGKEVEILCHDCGGKSIVKFYGALYKRKYLCQSCVKLGSKNPFYGKKHDDKLKSRLSEERKGSWCVGEKNCMYGVNVWDSYSETELIEKKRKNSENQKGALNHFYGKEHTEETKRHIAKCSKQWLVDHPEHLKRMHKLALDRQRRGFKSGIEKSVQKELEARSVRHKYSKILHRKYQFDFIIEEDILLEVHGDFWHANPDLYGEGKKPLCDVQNKKIELDARKKEYAEKYGYKIFYIWETEIKKGNFEEIDRICQLIGEKHEQIQIERDINH